MDGNRELYCPISSQHYLPTAHLLWPVGRPLSITMQIVSPDLNSALHVPKSRHDEKKVALMKM